MQMSNASRVRDIVRKSVRGTYRTYNDKGKRQRRLKFDLNLAGEHGNASQVALVAAIQQQMDGQGIPGTAYLYESTSSDRAGSWTRTVLCVKLPL